MKRRVIIYTYGSLTKRLRSLIAVEEKALTNDDPEGTCAANHRGAIRAYKLILKNIRCESEPEPAEIGSPSPGGGD